MQVLITSRHKYRAMSNKRNPKTAHEVGVQHHLSQPMVYQIRLQGHLGRQWAAWFEGLAITLEENGDTLLTGPIVDQAALYGLLRKVRDLGLPLLSVIRVTPDQSDTSEDVTQ